MSLKIDLAKPTFRQTTFSKVAGGTLFRNEVGTKGEVYLKLDCDVGLYNAVRLNDAAPVGIDYNRSIVLLNGHLNAEDL